MNNSDQQQVSTVDGYSFLRTGKIFMTRYKRKSDREYYS